MTVPLLEAIAVVPVAGLGYWYRGRLREVREARERDDPSTDGIIERVRLEARVTKEGWAVFGSIIVYWWILSIIF